MSGSNCIEAENPVFMRVFGFVIFKSVPEAFHLFIFGAFFYIFENIYKPRDISRRRSLNRLLFAFCMPLEIIGDGFHFIRV